MSFDAMNAGKCGVTVYDRGRIHHKKYTLLVWIGRLCGFSCRQKTPGYDGEFRKSFSEE